PDANPQPEPPGLKRHVPRGFCGGSCYATRINTSCGESCGRQNASITPAPWLACWLHEALVKPPRYLTRGRNARPDAEFSPGNESMHVTCGSIGHSDHPRDRRIQHSAIVDSLSRCWITSSEC